MVGKRWKFVKKTFNALGMAKAAQPKSSYNSNDNDDSHNSDVDIEVRKPSSQPITLEERNQTKRRQLRRKKKEPKVASKVAKEPGSPKPAAKPKSSKTPEAESDALARARARREELQQFKKRTEEDIFLCQALGMDTDGMCLRHPNQHITTLGSTFEEVHQCRICDSESQVGSKAPRQRKSMAPVINQVKALQANRDDWRKRTKVMFWTSKQALDFDSDDDQALDDQLALTKEEWEEQVTARVTQVVAWRDENQLQAHPIFSKYFKMMQLGISIEAAKNACQLDGYNPVVLDLDPAKPLKSQLGAFDKSTRLELEALVEKRTNENGEEELDVPELVTRVSASFHKQMARDMLEAVQTLDALTEKAKKKKKSKRDSSKSEKSKQRDSSSKEKKKEGDTGEKKKKSKRDSNKKDPKSPKRESATNSTTKKKKTRKSIRKSSSTKHSQENGTTGDVAAQAKIAELNLVLEEKNKEIESLKEQLRQKDTIIQHLSKRTTTAIRQKSNEFSSPTKPSMNNSDHAVVAPMSDNDDETSNDNVVQGRDVEYQLHGYDFRTGDSKSTTDSSKDGSESFAQDYVVHLNAERKQQGEHDGDESINSDAGAVPVVGDNANVAGDDDDDDTSSASDLITTEDDRKIWRLGGDDTLRTNPSHHELNPESEEKIDSTAKDGNIKDGDEKPVGASTDDDENNRATKQESEDSDSDSEDEQDTSHGSERDSDSDNDEEDDDEEEVWLSDLEGEGTERSNDSDEEDEEER